MRTRDFSNCPKRLRTTKCKIEKKSSSVCRKLRIQLSRSFWTWARKSRKFTHRKTRKTSRKANAASSTNTWTNSSNKTLFPTDTSKGCTRNWTGSKWKSSSQLTPKPEGDNKSPWKSSLEVSRRKSSNGWANSYLHSEAKLSLTSSKSASLSVTLLSWFMTFCILKYWRKSEVCHKQKKLDLSFTLSMISWRGKISWLTLMNRGKWISMKKPTKWRCWK